LSFAMPVAALAGTASDQIPSSQLTAAFQVAAQIPDGGTDPQVTALVELDHVYVVNGQLQMEKLDQSADDVVTFSVGQTSVTYDPGNPAADVLPFVAGATYTVSFIRFNGETYSNTVQMPAFPMFMTPAPNQVFKKTDAVNLAWNSVSASLGEFVLGTDCAN